MQTSPVRIIQISDIHLFEDPSKELLRVNTQQSFEAVVELLEAEKKPIDLIIISGDLSQDGSEKAYRRLANILESFEVPVYWIPGNHDDVEAMMRVYPCKPFKNDRHIILQNWQLILLDSQIPKAVPGILRPDQLQYLRDCLETNSKDHAVVFFHHQPIPIQSKWLDPLGLKNPEDLWQVLAQFPQIHTIFFGHIHQDFVGNFHGIECYAPPSTCIQFRPYQNTFALDPLPPGYRWIELYEDGHLETGVVRTAKYIGIFDKDAKGY